MSGSIRYSEIPCHCKGCSTAFKGTRLEIARSFKTHFEGAHIKINKPCDIEEAKKAKLVEIISVDAFNEIAIEKINEPEVSAKDELLNSFENNDKPKNTSKDSSYDLSKYLRDNQICREERQYALFLANLLSSNNDYAREQIGIGKYEIVEVFYEATLMRDYWWHNKENFNNKLWNYVKDIPDANGNKWFNDGELSETKNHANYWPCKYGHPLARWMVNAKPDIAIIYGNNGKCEISFIECKYISGIDTYKYNDGKYNFTKTQEEVQGDIIKFLCNKLKIRYGEKQDIDAGEVILVQFKGEHNQEKRTPNGWKVIEINKLVNEAHQK